MARDKKLEAPVTLFAAIEEKQHRALRSIAYKEHRSIADVVREAIDHYVLGHPHANDELPFAAKSERIVRSK